MTAQDCISKGRFKKEVGEDRYCCKLNEEKVRDIKQRFANGELELAPRLSKEYGVSRSAIYNIMYGVRWKHVTIK